MRLIQSTSSLTIVLKYRRDYSEYPVWKINLKKKHWMNESLSLVGE